MWKRQRNSRYGSHDPGNAENWRRLFAQLDRIERNQAMADATLDDILADTTAETTADASIVTLLNGLQTQLTQALSGATITPAQQAKINAIFTNMKANDAAIATA